MNDKNFIRIENTAKETVGKNASAKKKRQSKRRGKAKERTNERIYHKLKCT
jgi:hypothetical protein